MVHFFGAEEFSHNTNDTEPFNAKELMTLAGSFAGLWRTNVTVLYSGEGSVVHLIGGNTVSIRKDLLAQVKKGPNPGMFVGKVLLDSLRLIPALGRDLYHPASEVRFGFTMECLRDLLDYFEEDHNLAPGVLAEVDENRLLLVDPGIVFYADGLMASFFENNGMPGILGTTSFFVDNYPLPEQESPVIQANRMGQDLYRAAVGEPTIYSTPYPEWEPVLDDRLHRIEHCLADYYRMSVYDMLARRIVSTGPGLGPQPPSYGDVAVKIDRTAFRALLESVS